jgi:hypothetical protein
MQKKIEIVEVLEVTKLQQRLLPPSRIPEDSNDAKDPWNPLQ